MIVNCGWWMLQSQGGTPIYHPSIDWIFHYKPSSYYSIPIYGPPHNMDMYIYIWHFITRYNQKMICHLDELYIHHGTPQAIALAIFIEFSSSAGKNGRSSCTIFLRSICESMVFTIELTFSFFTLQYDQHDRISENAYDRCLWMIECLWFSSITHMNWIECLCMPMISKKTFAHCGFPNVNLLERKFPTCLPLMHHSCNRTIFLTTIEPSFLLDKFIWIHHLVSKKMHKSTFAIVNTSFILP